MRQCDKCRFCCWSFGVHDVPNEIKGIENKPSLTHCQYETDGCAIHGRDDYPPQCKTFFCPYLEGAEIHRPDKFQDVIEGAKGNIGSFIPMVPLIMTAKSARRLIEQTRSVPAVFILDSKWVQVVLPLDRKDDGTWEENPDTITKWGAASLQSF